MKLQLLISLFLSPVALAQHPLDFVPEDAIAVISVKDGDAINSIMNTISQHVRKADSNVLNQYLGQFIKNPDSVDLSSEVLLVIAPAAIVPGKPQGGMFGAIPQPTLICKAKQGQTIEILSPGSLKSSTTVEGWFIATAAEQWTPRTSEKLSPIIAIMPNSQISATLDFGTLWKQFGQMAQMLGGLGIGSLNTPGPTGVISPETKKATAAAGKAFRELMIWCAQVKDISFGIDFDSDTLVADFNVNMNDPKSIAIDNDSLIEMSMHLSDDMIQYAMSEKLLKNVISADLDSLQHLDSRFYGGPSAFISASVKALSELAKDSVVAYGLHPTNGVTISSLADVSDQNEYLERLPDVIEEYSGMFLQELHMALPPSSTPNTWNVSMIGSEDTEMELLNAVFPEGDQLRFGKQGNGRIAMSVGPKAWKAFVQSHSTPLSQALRKHNKRAEIDFALTVDVRSVVVGVSDIAKIAYPEDEIHIASSPSVKTSLMFGSTNAGSFLELTADLYGLATLVGEIDVAGAKSKNRFEKKD